jgi:hypothetical protein
MHDIMVKPLPPGCRLTAIFDVSWVFRPGPTNPLTSERTSLAILGRYLVRLCSNACDLLNF